MTPPPSGHPSTPGLAPRSRLQHAQRSINVNTIDTVESAIVRSYVTPGLKIPPRPSKNTLRRDLADPETEREREPDQMRRVSFGTVLQRSMVAGLRAYGKIYILRHR